MRWCWPAPEPRNPDSWGKIGNKTEMSYILSSSPPLYMSPLFLLVSTPVIWTLLADMVAGLSAMRAMTKILLGKVEKMAAASQR